MPPLIAQALYSPETLAKIKAVSDKYKLHLDVTGDIEAFVNLRIADKISDADFMTDVRTVVGDKELSDKIIADINATIFEPLKEALKHSTAEAAKPTVVTTPKPMQPTGPVTQLLKEPPLPAVVTVAAPKPTIVEQKMTAVAASEPVTSTPTTPTPQPATVVKKAEPPTPPAPARYHGGDPYREPFE